MTEVRIATLDNASAKRHGWGRLARRIDRNAKQRKVDGRWRAAGRGYRPSELMDQLDCAVMRSPGCRLELMRINAG
ncbi:hypothetical protein [Xanthomonas arboricola]|uniref:hypothetical protein n=1 Tax=Xanthomonas arboricola TaxID=56448 RepID=UPI001C614FE1|nr:hypothetical protein [Xanthomonas arboricola]